VSKRFQIFHLYLGLGIAAGLVLIHSVSRPEASGQGVEKLSLGQIRPGREILVDEAAVGEGFILRLKHPGLSQSMRVLDFTLPPSFAAPSYALAGEVSYQAPNDPGFLETWNIVAASDDGSLPEARYFSRTLGSGLTAPIQGFSNFRPFVLPFFLDQETRRPVRLELNVVLPGPGSVEVRNLRFVEGWGSQPGAWFSLRREGELGALVGIVFGLWGALLGIARGLWPDRAAAFVRVSSQAWILIGAASLGILFWASLAGQPWWVRQQFALCGVLLLALGIALRQDERRRLDAFAKSPEVTS
jgi:hypothetical protein